MEVKLSDKLHDIVVSMKTGDTEDKRMLVREVAKQYNLSEQDLFDLFYVGKLVYSQGTGLCYPEVAKLLTEAK